MAKRTVSRARQHGADWKARANREDGKAVAPRAFGSDRRYTMLAALIIVVAVLMVTVQPSPLQQSWHVRALQNVTHHQMTAKSRLLEQHAAAKLFHSQQDQQQQQHEAGRESTASAVPTPTPCNFSTHDRQGDCNILADAGECRRNPAWAAHVCPVSCRVCYTSMCRDLSKSCAKRSLFDGCYADKSMLEECAWTCNACKVVTDPKCARDPEEPPAIIPGSIEVMFRRIANGSVLPAGMSATVYSSTPWIVTVDGLLSANDAGAIRAVGGHGFTRSEDGNQRITEMRSSSTSVCNTKSCSTDKTVQRIERRIEELTGIPASYSEYLQLIRYTPGQSYHRHHDQTCARSAPWGYRIYTVLIYLSDVEAGGETIFPLLNISVAPKMGRAVIFPQVLDRDPYEHEDLTVHEAKPVISGIKYAANYLLHMFPFRKPIELRCNNAMYHDNWATTRAVVEAPPIKASASEMGHNDKQDNVGKEMPGPLQQSQSATTPVAEKSLCVDTSEHCPYWKLEGHCTSKALHMRKRCPLSCGVCKLEELACDSPEEPALPAVSPQSQLVSMPTNEDKNCAHLDVLELRQGGAVSAVVWRNNSRTCFFRFGAGDRIMGTEALVSAATDGAPDFGFRTLGMADYACGDAQLSYARSHERCSEMTIPDFVFQAWPDAGVHDFEATRTSLASIGEEPAKQQRCGWAGTLHNVARRRAFEIMIKQPSLFEVYCSGGAGGPICTHRKRIAMAEQVKEWSCLIDIRGGGQGEGYSGRVPLLLHTGRPLLYVERTVKAYYDDPRHANHMEPWKHYVPVHANLSDLVAKAKWILQSPEEAARIGAEGKAFAQKHLTRAAVTESLRKLLLNPAPHGA